MSTLGAGSMYVCNFMYPHFDFRKSLVHSISCKKRFGTCSECGRFTKNGEFCDRAILLTKLGTNHGIKLYHKIIFYVFIIIRRVTSTNQC